MRRVLYNGLVNATAKNKPLVEGKESGKKELISDILLWVIIIDYLVAIILKIMGRAIVKAPLVVFFIGFSISIGAYIIIRRVILTGILETNQDGKIDFSESPVKYVAVWMMWAFGYVMGLLSPWIMEA